MFLYPARTADVPAWCAALLEISTLVERAHCAQGQTKHASPTSRTGCRNGRAFERCEVGRIDTIHGWMQRNGAGDSRWPTGSRTAQYPAQGRFNLDPSFGTVG